MGKIRTGTPSTKEYWDVAEIMNHLKCDEMRAKQIFEDYHRENGGGYGKIEKALILDYIERKQREEREREARYQSDLANIEAVATLKEQVKALKEQVAVLKESAATSSKDAHSARFWALFASILSVVATLAAAFIPWLLNRP